MDWLGSTEFNEPVVRRHRKRAAQRLPRDAAGIAEILDGISGALERPEDQRVSALRSKWPEVAGKQIARHSQPGFIKGFTLHVFVDHPGWMPELERMKRILLERVQSRFHGLRIRRLVFLLEQK